MLSFLGFRHRLDSGGVFGHGRGGLGGIRQRQHDQNHRTHSGFGFLSTQSRVNQLFDQVRRMLLLRGINCRQTRGGGCHLGACCIFTVEIINWRFVSFHFFCFKIALPSVLVLGMVVVMIIFLWARCGLL